MPDNNSVTFTIPSGDGLTTQKIEMTTAQQQHLLIAQMLRAAQIQQLVGNLLPPTPDTQGGLQGLQATPGVPQQPFNVSTPLPSTADTKASQIIQAQAQIQHGLLSTLAATTPPGGAAVDNLNAIASLWAQTMNQAAVNTGALANPPVDGTGFGALAGVPQPARPSTPGPGPAPPGPGGNL